MARERGARAGVLGLRASSCPPSRRLRASLVAAAVASALLVSLLPGPRVALAIVADDLCGVAGADPCVIDTFHPIVVDFLDLDFGDRTVVLTGNGRLAFIDPDPELGVPPDVILRSAHLTTEPGSAIVSDGGRVRFRVGGDTIMRGDLTARGPDGADGGTVDVQTGGSFTLEGTIVTIGGRLSDDVVGDGGDVVVRATGALTIDAGSGDAIDASGGSGNAEEGGGSGGDLDLRSGGDLRLLAGRLRGIGRNDGSGSRVVLAAAGDVQVGSSLEIDAGPGGGIAGSVSVDAGGTTLLATDLLCGRLAIESAGEQRMTSDVACAEIALAAGGGVEIAPGATVAAHDSSGDGGPITIRSGAEILVASILQASGVLMGGSIQLLGCSVRITAGGVVDAGAPVGGTVDLGGTIMIEGAVSAETGGAISLIAPATAPPVIGPGASITPMPTVLADETIAACCTLDCGDDDPCTADVCVPLVGCTSPPSAGLDLLCTASCTGAPAGRPCRADACAGTTSCVAGVCPPGPPIDCEDDDLCNGRETCDPASGCVPGTPLVCDDDDACNGREGCDPLVGCTSGSPLADGTLCVVPTQCLFAGVCQGAACAGAERCDDGDPCHRGVCVPGVGCAFVDDVCPDDCAGLPDGTRCSDDDICDDGTACLGGVCQASVPRCPDGDACTFDVCDPDRGCLYFEFGFPPACIGNCAIAADGTRCFDGSLCTADVCTGGACVSDPVGCDDGDPTNGLEYCDPHQGCVAGVPLPPGSPTPRATVTSTASPTATPTPTVPPTASPTATVVEAPTVTATPASTPSPSSSPIASATASAAPVVDAYVIYRAKASARDDLPDGGKFPRRDYNVRLDDVGLANGAADDPENYQVRKERGLALPARKDAAPGPTRPDLHYVSYQVKEAREGVGAFDGSRYPKATRHVRRRWSLDNELGTIRVVTKKVEGVLVPAATSLVVAPSPPGDATHYLCYQAKVTQDVTEQTPDTGGGTGKLRKDLQAYFGDAFLDVDCRFDKHGQPSFAGSVVAGSCLLTLKKVQALCTPVAKDDVGGTPPRVTSAPFGSVSVPTTAESLLCYRVSLASRVLAQDVATLGNLGVGDAVRQSRHVRRTLAGGTAPHVAPGNRFPAPRQVDTTKLELACLPTTVLDVAPLE